MPVNIPSTMRALRVLGDVPLIAAEDTRQTRKLLDRYDLHQRHTALVLWTPPHGDVQGALESGILTRSTPFSDATRSFIRVAMETRSISGPSEPMSSNKAYLLSGDQLG